MIQKIGGLQPNVQVSQLQNQRTDAVLKKTDTGAYAVNISNEGRARSKLDGLFDELDRIAPLPELTASQEKEVDSIYAKIDAIFENQNMSEADEKQVDKLFEKLDSIFMPKNLSEEDQKRVDEINGEIDRILGEEGAGGFDDGYEDMDFTELPDSVEEKLEPLYTQLDEIYGVDSEPRLTRQQVKEVDEINKALDGLLSSQNSTEAEEKKADKLFARLDEIFGVKELSEKDQKRADEIELQIQKLVEPYQHQAG